MFEVLQTPVLQRCWSLLRCFMMALQCSRLKCATALPRRVIDVFITAVSKVASQAPPCETCSCIHRSAPSESMLNCCNLHSSLSSFLDDSGQWVTCSHLAWVGMHDHTLLEVGIGLGACIICHSSMGWRRR